MHTMQTGIAQFLGEGAGLWGPLTAASVLVCAPAVPAYLFWQRQIIETFAAAAGKWPPAGPNDGARAPRPEEADDMRVLVTNDDGIGSEGLHALVRAFATAHEVIVLAPSDDRSASSASLSVRRDIDAQDVPEVVRMGAAAAFQLAGTPATCVLVAAFGTLVPRPDLVVSGVNPGPNLGCDTYLSGTVGAARVATTLGIPGIAVSCRRDPAGPAWDTAARTARRVAELLAGRSLAADAAPGHRTPLVNLNVPSATPRAVTATILAGCHIVGNTVVELPRPAGETRRVLRLELTVQQPATLEPGTDAWAFFSGDTSVTVLDHPGDRPTGAGGSGRTDLAHYLVHHLGRAGSARRGPA